MPVKQKAAEKVKDLMQGQLSLEQKVDRWLELEGKAEAINAKIEKRVKVLREELAEVAEQQGALGAEIQAVATVDMDDEESKTIVGKLAECTIGKRKMATEITDMKKLFDLVGQGNFLKLCTFPIGKMKDYLTPEERELVAEVRHDGPRSFKVKPIKR